MKEQILEKFLVGKTQKEIALEMGLKKDQVVRLQNEIFNDKIPVGYERTLMMYKEDLEKALQMYIAEKKCSFLELERRFPMLKLTQIQRYIKESGVRIKTQTDFYGFVQYHDLWSPCSTELGAYLLGFFLADGHLEIKSDSSMMIKIGVNLQDAHILKLYKKAVNAPDYLIHVYGNQAYLTITSPNMSNALVKWGIDNHKTTTLKELPNIEESLIPHMIRGYFDGDGSAMFNVRKQNNRLGGYNRKFNISAGNYIILKSICDKLYLPESLIVCRKAHQRELKGVIANFKDSYTIDVNDITTLKRIYDYLYTDATYYFKRKKDKFYLCTLTNKEIDGVLQGNL